jgi:hypothetical protein
MVINEHWGKPNTVVPGTLWWINNNLQRKPMTAGWQSKKAAPWKQSHELLQISFAAHVADAMRIHCGSEDFEAWSKTCSFSEFEAVAERAHRELFTTRAYDRLKGQQERDTVLENTVLQNRDTLLYLLYTFAIKRGDIGLVVHVLRTWMVMMRTPKMMPKYADAIFELLGRLRTFPPKLKFILLPLSLLSAESLLVPGNLFYITGW